MFHAPNVLTILFGTETGNASVLADRAFFAATSAGIATRLADMATYNTFRIATERDILIITSTHGEGNPPQTASDFFDFLDETDVSLRNVRYGVLALGDSGYEDFCEAGKRLDRRLTELGATRLTPRQDIDVGEMKSAREWIDDFVRIVATSAATTRS
jgi:sulfite reductase (NADPH) flavoprotein alpha-component